MTTTLSPPAESPSGSPKRGKSSRSTVISGSRPQVNLLPPEVRAARGLKVIKRWLAVALVLVLALVGLAYGYALTIRSSAEKSLAEAQAETARLRSEEAQYSEVPLVLGSLEATLAAREFGMSTEVLWKPYFDAIAAVLPDDVSIESIALTGGTPVALPEAPASPLDGPSVARLSFVGQSATVPDTAAWIDALNSITGFSDAWVTSAAVDGAEGAAFYKVSSSVQVDMSAYALRFVTQEEG